jgi:cytoplasmic iron level regulating protein YaaA (DUF328/UPF0246 family)
MIAIISPAKTLDFEQNVDAEETSPRFRTEANKLVKELRKKSPGDLQDLMSISEKLAQLNVDRFHNFSTTRLPAYAKPALFAFQGDVYRGLEASSLNKNQISYLQNHLRILSGLYGLLRPLDVIQPYRLEMGTSLHVNGYDSLYAFWGDKIARALSGDLKEQQDEIIVNLASQEYFKAADRKALKGKVIDVRFEDFTNGAYKIIAVYAKMARGMMVRFMAEHEVTEIEQLKAFDTDGYSYDDRESTSGMLVFKRG